MAKFKLTSEKIAQLAKYMLCGAPMKDILAASAVPSSTYYRWMDIGKAVLEGDLEHPCIPKRPTRKEGEPNSNYRRRLHRYQENLKLCATLCEKMEWADAIARIEMQWIIQKSIISQKDWRGALKFLERRDPGNWSLKRIRRVGATAEELSRRKYMSEDPEMRELIRIFTSG